MAVLALIVLGVADAFVLAARRASLWLWAAGAVLATVLWHSGLLHGRLEMPPITVLGLLGWVPAVALVFLSVPQARRSLLVQPAFQALKKAVPKISATEQQAIDAGTIGFDAELFSGTPDWNKLRAIPPIMLTPEEKAFL